VSVLNDVRALEQRVTTRLAELHPLVEEYNELRKVAERLGLDLDRAAQPRSGQSRSSRRAGRKRATATRASASSSRRRPGGTRATGVERRARVIELVQQHPGISVPEISGELGVDAPPLYRVVRKLVADGVVKKEGKGLRPA
jgi:predicted HTH transcriptional regulator